MTRVLVSLCVLACACVKIPEFVPKDAPGTGSDGLVDGGNGPAPVTIVRNGDGSIDVTGPDYVIKFSNQGARFPYQLNPGPNLFLGGSEHCADEFGMGIAMYPSYRANGAPSANVTSDIPLIPLEGPYVGQVRLAWYSNFMCNTTQSHQVGQSTFSFFPDGRITRFDVVYVQEPIMSGQCDICTPNGQPSASFYLTSYTTLIVDTGIGATITDGNLNNLTMYGQEVSPVGSSSCVNERNYSMAFAWSGFDNNRVRVAAAPPTSASRTIAFVHDFVANSSTLAVTDFEVTTQMGFSSQQSCPVLEARLDELGRNDYQLLISGTPIGANLGDGIYGGQQAQGHAVDFPVTLSPGSRIPAGFAVWLRSGSIPPNLRLTHSANPTTPWYREQRVGADQVVFWFDVALEQNQTITIEAS